MARAFDDLTADDMVEERAAVKLKSEKTTNKFSLFGEDVVPKLLLYSGVIILVLIFIELKDPSKKSSSFQSNIQRLLGGIHFPTSQHKNLFPIDHADVIGSFLVSVSLMIAASGGIGGGGILVPLLIMVFGFHPKYAIPLCNSTVFGSSITNVFLNVSKRHPEADRPLIDWDLVLLMEPLTIAGAVRLYAPSLLCFDAFNILNEMISHFFVPLFPTNETDYRHNN